MKVTHIDGKPIRELRLQRFERYERRTDYEWQEIQSNAPEIYQHEFRDYLLLLALACNDEL